MDVVHFHAIGDPLNYLHIIGLHEANHVRALRLDDFRQRIRPAFAAVENVVTHQSHKRAKRNIRQRRNDLCNFALVGSDCHEQIGNQFA